MFNCSGAIEHYEVTLASKSEVDVHQSAPLSQNGPVTAIVSLKVRGCGRFGAYSSQRPLKCTINGNDTDFNYDGPSGLVTIMVPVPREEMHKWSIEIIV